MVKNGQFLVVIATDNQWSRMEILADGGNCSIATTHITDI